MGPSFKDSKVIFWNNFTLLPFLFFFGILESSHVNCNDWFQFNKGKLSLLDTRTFGIIHILLVKPLQMKLPVILYVVLCMHAIYHAKLYVVFSVAFTLVLATTFNILYLYNF